MEVCRYSSAAEFLDETKDFRKNGFASALTSEITKILISQSALPTLYTQASNPTSNKIYRELGYSLMDENRRVVFTI